MAYFRLQGGDLRSPKNSNQYTPRRHKEEVVDFLAVYDINSLKINNHTQQEDLKILLKMKMDLWVWMAERERSKWNFIWSRVYSTRKPLRPKELIFLGRTVRNCIKKQNRKYGKRV